MAQRRKRKLNEAVVLREQQVLQLRRFGATFEAIAKQLGYANEGGAYKAYQRACLSIIRDDVEDLRQLEIDRLDFALVKIMPKVSEGQLNAIDRMLRIMERRARLLGLDAPVKAELEVNFDDADTIDAEVARLERLLDSGKPSALDTRRGATESDT